MRSLVGHQLYLNHMPVYIHKPHYLHTEPFLHPPCLGRIFEVLIGEACDSVIDVSRERGHHGFHVGILANIHVSGLHGGCSEQHRHEHEYIYDYIFHIQRHN